MGKPFKGTQRTNRRTQKLNQFEKPYIDNQSKLDIREKTRNGRSISTAKMKPILKYTKQLGTNQHKV